MIAFLFSGQGAQYPGMMKDIAEQSPEAKAVFNIADQTLNRNISELCFNGTQEELNLTHNTQPCVLAADLAAFKAISAAGIKADAVAGFSLGEYAALVVAGVIDINDVFPLVQKRADYMQEAVPIGRGAMAAVMKITSEEVENLCGEVDGYIIPANYNCPGQTVVSGEAEAIDKLLELTRKRKIKAIKLTVSAPFHCEMMAQAATNLRNPLQKIEFGVPVVPIYMNVDARMEKDPAIIREKLILQAKSPVRWEDTLRSIAADGVDTFIELGPGKTLSGFVRKTLGENVRVHNVENLESLEVTLEGLKD